MKLSLNLNSKITLLTLVMLPILISLGRWQLERAEEKREIENLLESRQQQEAVQIEALDPEADLRFTPVVLSGRFDEERQILLDNRMYDGQLGYEVLTPFVTDNGSRVLVNRGWIKGNMDRRTLPAIPPAGGQQLTRGFVYVSPGKPFLLKEQVLDAADWPLVVQAIEVEKFSEVLAEALFPHVVRLEAGAPGGLTIDWQPINQEPEKHIAYAVQWFTMATALVLWFVFANTNVRQFVQLYPRTERQERKAKRNDTH